MTEYVIVFIGALSLAVLVFELATTLTLALNPFAGHGRLDGAHLTGAETTKKRPSTWQAILIAFFPLRFDPGGAKNITNVIGLLRRSGYIYETPGDFYTAAIRTFGFYLGAGGMVAGLILLSGKTDNLPFAVVIAAVCVLQGLRRPYADLKKAIKRRSELTRNNMLIGLATLNALLTTGMQVQEAMRRVATIGGPFCNLLGLLIARMEIDNFTKALEVTRAHLPDADDLEMNLFLKDIEDYFTHNRPLQAGVEALCTAVHRRMVEDVEKRAAMVKQRAGIFGILAVGGLMLTLILPNLSAIASAGL
jgi:hypothetical protein